MASFEYKVINLDHVPDEVDERNLNALGDDGWEVVSVTPLSSSMRGSSSMALSLGVGGDADVDFKSQTDGVTILLKRFAVGCSATTICSPAPRETIVDLLLDESAFVRISELQARKDLHCPGLYCIKLAPGGVLPEPFASKLQRHRIIYIGQASTSLYDRFWNQELNAVGHGTFFRSIGAVLGYLPPWGSLKGKTTRNYKFSQEDEFAIKDWLQVNVVVNCCGCPVEEVDSREEKLIRSVRPLLNLAKNPASLPELTAARNRCLEYAQGAVERRNMDTDSARIETCTPKVEGFDKLRKALLENLRMQEEALKKGKLIDMACTDVHSVGKDDEVFLQFISDFLDDCHKAALLVTVPLVDGLSPMEDFKCCPVSSEFNLFPGLGDMVYSYCGKDVEKAIMLFKRVTEEFYCVDPKSDFRFEKWMDLAGE